VTSEHSSDEYHRVSYVLIYEARGAVKILHGMMYI